MTLRRLYVLLRALPPDCLFKTEMREAHNRELTAAERIRERQAAYSYLEQ